MTRLNGKSYTLVTAPAVEPVSLSELKLYAKVDGSEEDSLLTALITTARQAAEDYTCRSFITQTWQLVADRFGEPLADTVPPGWVALSQDYLALRLSRGPWQSITDIKTTALDNTESTVSASTYTLDTSAGRVMLNSGFAWPTGLRDYAAVKVTFVTGYGAAAASVPAQIKQAILMHAATLYETRCHDMAGPVKALLDPFRAAESFGAW